MSSADESAVSNHALELTFREIQAAIRAEHPDGVVDERDTFTDLGGERLDQRHR